MESIRTLILNRDGELLPEHQTELFDYYADKYGSTVLQLLNEKWIFQNTKGKIIK